MNQPDHIITSRRQLTLFVPAKETIEIEKIRREYNPLQFELIKAHVTICREDELHATETIFENLSSSGKQPLTIHFGKPNRFSDGQGLLMPGKGENKAFHELRNNILKNTGENHRIHPPHITLLHPRNSNCTDEIFQQLKNSKLPLSITFDKISLIEQVNDEPWKVLKEFNLQ